MNKKILIGVIISIIVLVGVSFTSVVGYGSVASDVNESPLFNIRSSRAIDEESGDLSCEYVGKDIGVLSFPSKLDSKDTQITEVINQISKMSGKAYSRFIAFIIGQLQNKDRLKIINSKALILTLNRYRNLPVLERNFNNLDTDDPLIFSASDPIYCTAGGVWGPGCWIWELLNLIVAIIAIIDVVFYTIFCTL
jgi:hypothetical protein